FISMSHFVNRVRDHTDYRSEREEDYAQTGNDEARAMMVGALQAAIDMSEINEESPDGDSRFNNPNYELREVDLNQIYSELDIQASIGDRVAGIPGYLTQLDLLDAMGPYISVRSDTFVIHAYGESIDPLTGDVLARAQCRVTVQRTPNFVDKASGDAPETPLHQVSAINQNFGRQFRIIDFQWQTPLQ
ncbi:MAG: hypothetical protein ACQKBV_05995, partial [Puniceicoccales bacterium]